MRTLALASFLVIALPAAAQLPMPFGANFYEFVPANITWQNALAAASMRSFAGVPGHLATITSAGENTFLASLISNPTFAGVWCAGQIDSVRVGRWVAGPET
ncbi:MAG: hypothetical protein HZB39_05865, partial [Planctomycetes bacterium]|nr:hypothetical protein [Planctomycetota bacterium]